MIDSAKVQQLTKKPELIIKDTQPAVEKINVSPVLKKDSTATKAKPKTPANFIDSFLATTTVTANPTDSLHADSTVAAAIMPFKRNDKQLTWQQDTAFARLLSIISAKSKATSVNMDGSVHVSMDKDYLFYLLISVVLLLAVIKQLFPKYFQQLFRIMFQASFRQKQTREQLMQEKMPSLLLNLLFILTGGLFIALIAGIYKWLDTPFWLLTLYSITLLALVYMFKYLVIHLMGWAFQAKEQASTYGFIVFLINKIAGLALLPLLLLLAFSSGYILQVTVTVAFCLIALLLLFRYILSLTIIRSALSIHPIHFFIYLCGVELMPMLIIYKVLFNFTGKSN